MPTHPTTTSHECGGSVWSGRDTIQDLYDIARHEGARHPIWDELRQAEAAQLPTCANHPGRPAAGGFEDAYFCAECVGAELARRRLWLRSFSVVRGGVEALR